MRPYILGRGSEPPAHGTSKMNRSEALTRTVLCPPGRYGNCKLRCGRDDKGLPAEVRIQYFVKSRLHFVS